MKEQRRRRTLENLNLSSNLPHDLILQILLRLPVRSLLRFKSVCKSWRSSPKFAKSHFDLAASPTHRYIGDVSISSEMESIDIDAPLHHYESSLVNLKFPLSSSPDETGTVIPYADPDFVGSCRGFILVAYESGNTIIWNPSTGSQRRIPEADNLTEEATLKILIGFGYDTSTDDYLLVLIQMIRLNHSVAIENEAAFYHDSHNHIDFFSLRTNSWSALEVANVKYAYNGADLVVGSYLNDALHWLVISLNTKLQVIIAFDLVERTLSEIPISYKLARRFERKQYYCLRVMGECLSLCYPGDADSMAEIWMMKEYKVQSSWTKLFVFSTSNIPCNSFVQICFTKHGGIFGSNGAKRLMILNDKGWLLDQCTIDPDADEFQYIQVDCDIYRESLLSLPNDFEEASEDDQLTSSLEKGRGPTVTDNKN